MSDPVSIVIVDDHQVVVEGLVALLEKDPEIRVAATANSGSEAIQILESLSPDLVIMDVDMEGMDGIEATGQIKERWPNQYVMALTMHQEKAVINKMLEAGANGYMLKSANMEELAEAVKKVAAGKQYFSDEVTVSLLDKSSSAIETPSSTSELVSQLTSREVEILQFISQGFTNREIGERLFISHRTVDTHRTNLQKKIGVNNIAGLVRFTVENGLLDE